jgi:hypothetical protein
MGCRQPGSEKKSPEAQKVLKIEENLGFSSHSADFYEGIMARVSKAENFDSALSFFSRCSKKNLNETLKELIKSQFGGDSKLDLKGLRCFFIVLSSGNDLQKGESLWYTFDEKVEDVLSAQDVRKIIQNVVRGSVNVIVSFVIREKGEESLRNWQNYLKERVESLECRLFKHFTQGKDLVCKDEFLLRLQDKPEGMITRVVDVVAQLERSQVIPNKFASPFKNMKVTKLTR